MFPQLSLPTIDVPQPAFAVPAVVRWAVGRDVHRHWDIDRLEWRHNHLLVHQQPVLSLRKSLSSSRCP